LADQRVSTPRGRTLFSAGVAVAAHAVLILLLALGIRVVRPPNETPPLEVTLTRLFAPHPRPAPKPAPQAARHPSPPVAPRQATPSPLAPPLPPPVALPENGPIDPRLAAAEAVRGALQGIVRCAHPDEFHLDPAEQAACARLNRQMATGAPTYTVDPADHARHDPLVASHGMAVKDHLSPRPGTDLGPLDLGPVKGVSH
jgi:hypothetical protein